MNILVGIPCYNEAASIKDVINAIPRTIRGASSVTVLVVDDGSTDDTATIAEASGALVYRHESNRGLGMTFQSMVSQALNLRTDVLVTIDGDGQFNPADIPTLVAPILQGEALACTASRFSSDELVPAMPWVKRWGNRRVARLVSAMAGKEYRDVSCGYRAYSREALLRSSVHGRFTYTHETFLDLATKSIFFKEIPLKVRGVREHGKSRMASSVLKYGLRTSSIMLRFYRDHHPLGLCFYFSLPFALLGFTAFGWSLYRFFLTGSWLKWAGFLGGALEGVALLVIFFGFMADISSRLRKNQEEILYWQRKIATERSPGVQKPIEDTAVKSSP